MVQFSGPVACTDTSSTATVMTDACVEGGGAFSDGGSVCVNWATDYPTYSAHHIHYTEAAMAARCIQRATLVTSVAE